MAGTAIGHAAKISHQTFHKKGRDIILQDIPKKRTSKKKICRLQDEMLQ